MALSLFRIPRAGRRIWQWLVPVLCVLLFLTTVIWLPRQAQEMESTERQEQLIADTLWVEQTIRFQLGRNEDDIRVMAHEISAGRLAGQELKIRMSFLLRTHPELMRIIWVEADGGGVASDAQDVSLDGLSDQLHLALTRVRGTRAPEYTQPTRQDDPLHPALMEYLFPVYQAGRYIGCVIATYNLNGILEQMVPWWFAQKNEVQLTDRYEHVLGQRTAGGRGRGVYTYTHDLHLPYADITLHTEIGRAHV